MTTYSVASNIPWRLLVVLLLVNLGFVVITLVQPFSRTAYTYVYGLDSILYPLVLAYLCLKGLLSLVGHPGAPATGLRAGRRFSPLFIAFHIFVFASMQLVLFMYLLIKRNEAPFPSLPYYLIFGIHPCLIAAILLLPARGVSWLARLRIFLDSLIIIVALATLCYYFVLAPLLSTGDGTLEEKTVGVLYTMAYLVVAFCLLLVALRSGE